jgi:hypothetical protein
LLATGPAGGAKPPPCQRKPFEGPHDARRASWFVGRGVPAHWSCLEARPMGGAARMARLAGRTVGLAVPGKALGFEKHVLGTAAVSHRRQPAAERSASMDVATKTRSTGAPWRPSDCAGKRPNAQSPRGRVRPVLGQSQAPAAREVCWVLQLGSAMRSQLLDEGRPGQEPDDAERQRTGGRSTLDWSLLHEQLQRRYPRRVRAA